MRRTWRGMALLAAAAAVLVAGCGDDDDGGDEALTEEAFLERGNAICQAGNDRLDARAEELFPSEEDFEDLELRGEFRDELVDDIEDQIEALRALEPPDALAADAEALFDDAEAALEELREQEVAEVFEGEDPFAEVNEAAAELGLTACGDEGGEEGDGADSSDEEGDDEGADGADPEVSAFFLSPADGDTVASPVALSMAATGIAIEPAANGVNEGAGHFHVIVDHGCVEPGETIPTDTEGYNHFGQGQTETELALEPGEHTLCLQVGNGAHTALDITDEITVIVSE